jgi:hypothetical protein
MSETVWATVDGEQEAVEPAEFELTMDLAEAVSRRLKVACRALERPFSWRLGWSAAYLAEQDQEARRRLLAALGHTEHGLAGVRFERRDDGEVWACFVRRDGRELAERFMPAKVEQKAAGRGGAPQVAQQPLTAAAPPAPLSPPETPPPAAAPGRGAPSAETSAAPTKSGRARLSLQGDAVTAAKNAPVPEAATTPEARPARARKAAKAAPARDAPQEVPPAPQTIKGQPKKGSSWKIYNPKPKPPKETIDKGVKAEVPLTAGGYVKWWK